MMSTTNSDTYNGHVNRETWAMGLHLSNDQELYQSALGVMRSSSSTEFYGDVLREWVTDLVDVALNPHPGEHPPQIVLSMIGDVGSFWRVDWDDVAMGLVES
tara:strand:+ start:2448 stop:2753 length:306 start_codon:yes stop_codon:yes gene_type:complete